MGRKKRDETATINIYTFPLGLEFPEAAKKPLLDLLGEIERIEVLGFSLWGGAVPCLKYTFEGNALDFKHAYEAIEHSVVKVLSDIWRE